jgi:hypothetical protein
MFLSTFNNALPILTTATNATQAPRLLAQIVLNSSPSEPTGLTGRRLLDWYTAELACGFDATAPLQTVDLSTLWQDGTGFLDTAFEKWVRRFRAQVGSSVSHDDLKTANEDEGDGITWEIVPGNRFEVRTVYAVDAHGTDSEMVAIADHVGERLAECYADQVATSYGIWDTEDDSWVDDFSEIETPDMELQTQYGDTLDVYCDESEADDSAEELNRIATNENAYGVPWAQYASYRVDGLSIEALLSAGFQVAEHMPSGTSYFGVDGGGYCQDVHWVKLALLCWGPGTRSSDGVPTDSGQRVFVAGYSV